MKNGLTCDQKDENWLFNSGRCFRTTKEQAPIVADILTYRQIAKIQSTYVEGLLKVIQPDNKIHTGMYKH